MAASFPTIGLIGGGSMGSAVGASWSAGGAEVITSVEGRSERTRSLVERSGLRVVPRLEDVLEADYVVSIVPPGRALDAARSVAKVAARTSCRPIYADLNAIAPSTFDDLAQSLTAVGIDTIDGSISGYPPRAGTRRTRIYLSGEASGELAAIPSPWVEVVYLGRAAGMASGLKMCTASMYKGINALVIQALVTADAHGVVEPFLADTAKVLGEQLVASWPYATANAATKAWRFIEEMYEISRAQADLGLAGSLFQAMADVFTLTAKTHLGSDDPDQIPSSIPIDELIAGLKPACDRSSAGAPHHD